MISISQTLEDYIEAIYILESANDVARIKDLSAMLDVKPPTAVRRLEDENLLKHERYGYIRLTPRGKKLAEQIYQRHKTLLRFLVQVLGIPPDMALSQACGMEHSITGDTRDILEQLVDFLESDSELFARWLEQRKSIKE